MHFLRSNESTANRRCYVKPSPHYYFFSNTVSTHTIGLQRNLSLRRPTCIPQANLRKALLSSHVLVKLINQCVIHMSSNPEIFDWDNYKRRKPAIWHGWVQGILDQFYSADATYSTGDSSLTGVLRWNSDANTKIRVLLKQLLLPWKSLHDISTMYLVVNKGRPQRGRERFGR